MTKNQNFFQFSKIFEFFVKFAADFVDRNVLGVQQGKGWFQGRLFREFIAIFQVKMSQIDTENDRNPKIFQCSKN